MKEFISQQMFSFVNPVEWVRAMRESRSNRRSLLATRSKALADFRQRLKDIASKYTLDKMQLALFPNQSATIVERHALLDVAKEMVTWSDSDLVAAHDAIIQDALVKLRDTTSKAIRRELFEWFTPSAHHEQPFSLDSCCAIAGMDADEIRRQVFRIYRDEILSLIAEGQELRASGKTIIQDALGV